MDNINQSIRKRPYFFIKRALEQFHLYNGKNIVELGSMRQICTHDLDDVSGDCCNDGHSSLLLARACSSFSTCDINKDSSRLTFNELKKHNLIAHSNVYNGDGITFLKQFQGNIDLLYLDAWDVGTPQHAEKHLEAFQAAESKLSRQNIILIDDTDIRFTPERGYHNDEESLDSNNSTITGTYES